jgi:hypothetical protein
MGFQEVWRPDRARRCQSSPGHCAHEESKDGDADEQCSPSGRAHVESGDVEKIVVEEGRHLAGRELEHLLIIIEPGAWRQSSVILQDGNVG